VSEAHLTVGHTPDLDIQEAPAFAISHKKLVMWLFIISDAITFGALLFAYGYLRNATPDWPRPFEASSVVNASVMTFILVTSSLTMLIAIRAARAGDKGRAVKWSFITVVGGLIFALLHIKEWLSLISGGLQMFANPWGSGLFGAAFFSITGLHLTHVVGGCIAITVVTLGYKRGRYDQGDLEIWGLYWHFVDLVWMFVVPFVYLLNIKH
jgi:heme/copper-type cytochrome/quinol oxidase subunit 3